MSDNINIKSDEIVRLAHGQAVVEARQAIDGECRILSACASASAVPGEVFAGEARYSGKVRFDCLAQFGDKVDCISVVAEFSDKIAAADITTGMKIAFIPEVINVEASVDGGAVKTVAVVDVTAIAVRSVEYACIAEPEQGIYAEKQTVEHCALCAEQSETVYVADSVSAGKASEVLFVTSKAVVTGAQAADGAVKVTGAVYSYIVVRTDGDMISAERVVTPFAKDVSAHGATESNIAFATATVETSAATAVVGENRIELAVTLCLDVFAMDCSEIEVVTDVFCADNEIEVMTASAECYRVEPSVTVTDTVDGQIPLASDRLAADNVLCVTGTFCTLSDVKIDDKRVTAEGLIGGDIVYYNAEKNVADTIAFRLPFSIPLSVHATADEIRATAIVTDVAVRVRRESVFDIKAEVAFTLDMSTRKPCTLVTEVTVGEPIPRPDASVIVHIAKAGETLWQAAKALCCSPERVREQNASATAPYAGGERLINFCNK